LVFESVAIPWHLVEIEADYSEAAVRLITLGKKNDQVLLSLSVRDCRPAQNQHDEQRRRFHVAEVNIGSCSGQSYSVAHIASFSRQIVVSRGVFNFCRPKSIAD